MHSWPSAASLGRHDFYFVCLRGIIYVCDVEAASIL